ncbi:MAG: flagella basal body P-ring formation protein FlgA [Nitrospirae bacterium]|nr:MAG: flagella basal body P-ring formation protein FlgA [Nitrospirota bacterium]
MIREIVLWLIVGMYLLVQPGEAEARGGNTRASLKVTTQLVTQKHLEQALLAQLHRQFPLKNVELSVQVLYPKQPVTVPNGKLVIQVPPDTMDGRTGRRAFRVALLVDAHLVQTVNVVAELMAKSQVVAPVRWIKAKELLEADDLTMISHTLPALVHDFIQDMHQAVGKQATRLLRPNAPIQHAYLALPPVIHKGDRVIIEARRGGLLVQTVGIAKASGQAGKMIPVENQRSGREILGRVLAAGLVEVQF